MAKINKKYMANYKTGAQRFNNRMEKIFETAKKNGTLHHQHVKCNIRGCKEEASRWFDTAELSGDFDMKARDTFYLCDDHAERIAPDDEAIEFLNPETGRLRRIELAVYACSETCPDCN